MWTHSKRSRRAGSHQAGPGARDPPDSPHTLQDQKGQVRSAGSWQVGGQEGRGGREVRAPALPASCPECQLAAGLHVLRDCGLGQDSPCGPEVLRFPLFIPCFCPSTTLTTVVWGQMEPCSLRKTFLFGEKTILLRADTGYWHALSQNLL